MIQLAATSASKPAPVALVWAMLVRGAGGKPLARPRRAEEELRTAAAVVPRAAAAAPPRTPAAAREPLTATQASPFAATPAPTWKSPPSIAALATTLAKPAKRAST